MRQAGNALFIILVTIVLLGLLTYTVTQSSDVLDQNADSQNAYLSASEMLKYAGRVKTGVERLMLVKGCAFNEMSFDYADRNNYNTSGYYLNANSPDEGTCDVFGENGGNVPYEIPPSAAQAQGGDEYNVQNHIEVAGVGSSGASDLMLVTFVTEDICYNVNRILGIDNPSGVPPEFSAAASFSIPATATESFPDFTTNSNGLNTPDIEIGGDAGTEADELAGKKAGCFLASNSLDKYIFYYVLVGK